MGMGSNVPWAVQENSVYSRFKRMISWLFKFFLLLIMAMGMSGSALHVADPGPIALGNVVDTYLSGLQVLGPLGHVAYIVKHNLELG